MDITEETLSNLKEVLLYYYVNESLTNLNINFSSIEKADSEKILYEIKKSIATFCDYICRYNYLPDFTIFGSTLFWSQYLESWDDKSNLFFYPPAKIKSTKGKRLVKEFHLYNKFLSHSKNSMTSILFKYVINQIKHNNIIIRYIKEETDKIFINFEFNFKKPQLILISIIIPDNEADNKLFFEDSFLDENLIENERTLSTFQRYMILNKSKEFEDYLNKKLKILQENSENLKLETKPSYTRDYFGGEDNIVKLKQALVLIGYQSFWKNIFVLPAITPTTEGFIGNGLLFLVMEDINAMHFDFTFLRIFNIKNLFSQFISKYILPDWELKVISSIMPHALKSSVASIMARNMSHIHGSHIEHGLRNQIDTLDDLWFTKFKDENSIWLTVFRNLEQNHET